MAPQIVVRAAILFKQPDFIGNAFVICLLFCSITR